MAHKTKEITIKTRKQWRNWLEKNHLKEKKVFLISYKKHTGNPSISHREAMEEAICFGWIDTTIKRIDDEKFGRYFVKRNKNSRWSDNTLSYGKALLEEGKMSGFGKEMYLLGKSKKTHDHGIPKNPAPPEELLREINKTKKARENFQKLAPSYKRTLFRWIISAKLPETRKKRINTVAEAIKKGRRIW